MGFNLTFLHLILNKKVLSEDLDLTFNEIVSILQKVAAADIQNVTEKVDGQNLFLTVADGEIRTARNNGDVKKGGMTTDEYISKWKGHPAENAFTNGFKAVSASLRKLSPEDLEAIFANGQRYVNMEIMYPNNPNIILDEPLGYLEFTCLMANCKYVVTDSGGLQEECTALDIPCFTLRENTERPSTLIENNGTNQLIRRVREIELKPCKGSMDLWDGNSSERIKNILIVSTSKIVYDYLINRGDIEIADNMLNNNYILAKGRYTNMKLNDNPFLKELDIDNYGKFLFYGFRPYQQLLYAFRITGNTKYIQYLKQQVQFYLDSYDEDGIKHYDSKGHALAFRGIYLVYISQVLNKLNMCEKQLEDKLLKDITDIGDTKQLSYSASEGKLKFVGAGESMSSVAAMSIALGG
mgnify:CR=1 FL=1